MDIQGDGFFALFHGELAYERAFCAAMTLKTFSERHFVPVIRQTMPGGYPTDTGLKTGIAASTLLVKRIGTRTATEEVWAGKAVNWAAKCAQAADAHQLIVTPSVYEKLDGNAYISHGCRCANPVSRAIGFGPDRVWQSIQVRALGSAGQHCRMLKDSWCEKCDAEFCTAILAGETNRDDVPGWWFR